MRAACELVRKVSPSRRPPATSLLHRDHLATRLCVTDNRSADIGDKNNTPNLLDNNNTIIIHLLDIHTMQPNDLANYNNNLITSQPNQ